MTSIFSPYRIMDTSWLPPDTNFDLERHDVMGGKDFYTVTISWRDYRIHGAGNSINVAVLEAVRNFLYVLSHPEDTANGVW